MDKNIKTVLIIGGIILGVLIVWPLLWGLLSGWRHGGWGMMGPMEMVGFGWMWLMPVIGILILGLIIWAIVELLQGLGSRGSDSALEILKKKYARGEISREEYEEKKIDIPNYMVITAKGSLFYDYLVIALGKVLFEKWWLAPFGVRKSVLRFLLNFGANLSRLPIRV